MMYPRSVQVLSGSSLQNGGRIPRPHSRASLHEHSGDETEVTRSMVRAASHVSIDIGESYSSESTFILPKGIWHVYRVEKNHFCGTQWDRQAKDLYLSLFRLLNDASRG